jgi:hypothetical protein
LNPTAHAQPTPRVSSNTLNRYGGSFTLSAFPWRRREASRRGGARHRSRCGKQAEKGAKFVDPIELVKALGFQTSPGLKVTNDG